MCVGWLHGKCGGLRRLWRLRFWGWGCGGAGGKGLVGALKSSVLGHWGCLRLCTKLAIEYLGSWEQGVQELL